MGKVYDRNCLLLLHFNSSGILTFLFISRHLSYNLTHINFVLVTMLAHGLGSLKPSGDQHNTDGRMCAHTHALYTPNPCVGVGGGCHG